jgi:hypothetical protein
MDLPSRPPCASQLMEIAPLPISLDFGVFKIIVFCGFRLVAIPAFLLEWSGTIPFEMPELSAIQAAVPLDPRTLPPTHAIVAHVTRYAASSAEMGNDARVDWSKTLIRSVRDRGMQVDLSGDSRTIGECQ